MNVSKGGTGEMNVGTPKETRSWGMGPSSLSTSLVDDGERYQGK
jgi:hypothetical protein